MSNCACGADAAVVVYRSTDVNTLSRHSSSLVLLLPVQDEGEKRRKFGC